MLHAMVRKKGKTMDEPDRMTSQCKTDFQFVPKARVGQIRQCDADFQSAKPRPAEHVSSQSKPLSTAVSRLEREIELLREYRTRLVADVVTGKLDVRPPARHAAY
jgi:hypothetical protein